MLEPFTFDSDFLISYQINYIIFRKWSKATRTLPIFSFILLQQKHLWLLFSMNKSHMWLQIYKYKGANVTFEWLFYFMNWRQMYLQIAFWWKGKATNVTFERFFFLHFFFRCFQLIEQLIQLSEVEKQIILQYYFWTGIKIFKKLTVCIEKSSRRVSSEWVRTSRRFNLPWA